VKERNFRALCTFLQGDVVRVLKSPEVKFIASTRPFDWDDKSPEKVVIEEKAISQRPTLLH
jgi:hypothetical protein